MTGTKTLERGGLLLLLGEPGVRLVGSEQDALELIGFCLGNDIDRLLLRTDNLDPAFFDLSSGLAGMVLQKFRTYRLRVVLLVPAEIAGHGRFAEMAREENRSPDLRVYADEEEALAWLSS